MTYAGLQIESNDHIPRGSWCCFAGTQLLAVITKDRRDFLDKFGIAVTLPVRTNRIVVDPEQYRTIRGEIEETR